jgi:hypothetical protein
MTVESGIETTKLVHLFCSSGVLSASETNPCIEQCSLIQCIKHFHLSNVRNG